MRWMVEHMSEEITVRLPRFVYLLAIASIIGMAMDGTLKLFRLIAWFTGCTSCPN